jgi:hypothetical protein
MCRWHASRADAQVASRRAASTGRRTFWTVGGLTSTTYLESPTTSRRPACQASALLVSPASLPLHDHTGLTLRPIRGQNAPAIGHVWAVLAHTLHREWTSSGQAGCTLQLSLQVKLILYSSL